MKKSITINKEKAIDIWSNYTNGNKLEFRRQVRALSKLNLINLIYFILDEYQGDKYTAQEVLSICYEVIKL
jgi:hypothetical protein